MRSRVVYASKERVKQDAITYEELADPKWKGKICIRSGQHVYNTSLIATIIAHKGEASTEAWLKGVKANLAHKPAGGDREQARDIYSGKCDLALGNTYYMALMAKNEKNPEQKEWGGAIKPLFPNANDRGSHVNISGMALAKHAPNKANALKLMEFLASEEAQKIYATANNEYPVNPKVPAVRDRAELGHAEARSAAAREHRQVSQEGVRAGRQGQLRRRPELVSAARRRRACTLQSPDSRAFRRPLHTHVVVQALPALGPVPSVPGITSPQFADSRILATPSQVRGQLAEY